MTSVKEINPQMQVCVARLSEKMKSLVESPMIAASLRAHD